MTNDTDELTVLLRAWNGGSGPAGDAVMALVYDRIRSLAASRLRQGGGRAAIQPTPAPRPPTRRTLFRTAGVKPPRQPDCLA